MVIDVAREKDGETHLLQFSNARYQVRFYADISFEKLPIVTSAFINSNQIQVCKLDHSKYIFLASETYDMNSCFCTLHFYLCAGILTSQSILNNNSVKLKMYSIFLNNSLQIQSF